MEKFLVNIRFISVDPLDQCFSICMEHKKKGSLTVPTAWAFV